MHFNPGILWATRSSSPPTQPSNYAIRFKTIPNEMGVFHIYPRYPSIPKWNTLNAVSDTPTLQDMGSDLDSGLSLDIPFDKLYSVFSHPMAGLLMAWQYSGGMTKSADELDHLWMYIQDLALNPMVNKIFSHNQEKKHIEKYLEDSSNPFKTTHGWQHSSVKIPLPHKHSKFSSEWGLNLPWLTVDSVYHCNITDIIISAFKGKDSSTYHIFLYKEYWKPSGNSEPIHLFGKAYSSPVFVEAYQEIHSLPHDPGDDPEHVITLLIFWSNATQLMNFGDASLWPIYLYFANQSKYTHGKPTADACHHVAYIPCIHHLYISCQIAHFSL